MEAVGVAAAALQFADTSIKLLKALRAVRNKVKDAPSDIESWRQELGDVQGIIESIQHSPSHHGIDVAVTINACEATCQKLLDIFDKLEFSDADSILQKTWRSIKGLDQEPTIRNLFQDLQSQKVNLVLKMGVGQSGQLRNLHQDVRTVARDLRTILSQGRVRIGSEDERCLQDLFLTDPARNRDAIVTTKGKRVLGTCEWILQTDIYNTWLNSDESSNLLWISGGPGKGKTFLSIFLTEELASSPSRTTIYYFFNHQIEERNSAVALLRGLIYQLVIRHSQLMPHLLKPWRVQQATMFTENSFEVLWSVFSEMLMALDRENVDVILVLDALDEIQGTHLQPVLAKLSNIFTQAKLTRFKTAILSRSYPRIIHNTLGEFPNIQLDPTHDDNIQSDIKLYIDHKVDEISIHGGYQENTELVQYIKDTFQERSEGTFLWVSFMAAELQNTYLSEIETAICNLPQGLNAIYRRILLEISTKSQPLTRKLLQWVALAQRPLFIAELVEALGISDSDKFSKWEICFDLISSCGHMLRISRDQDPILPELKSLPSSTPEEINAWSTTVSFFHQSAKDFLTSSEAQGGLDKFQIQTNRDHLEITQSLLAYFGACSLNTSDLWTRKKLVGARAVDIDLVHQHPLLSYACCSWFAHMGKLDDKHVNILCQNNDFFKEKSAVRDQWTYYMGSIDSQRSIPLIYTLWQMTLLQLACELQLETLVRWTLNRNRSLLLRKRYIHKMFTYRGEARGRQRPFPSPFVSQVAVRVFCRAIGAGAKSLGYDGIPSALEISCRRGDVEIIRLLMEAGGGLSMSKTTRVLRQAVNSGYLETIHLLIEKEKKAQRYIQKESRKSGHLFYRSLLCLAAECGDAGFCELLLDKYHYPIQQTFLRSNDPLVLALRNDHVDLARSLVTRWGANIDDLGKRHWRLLDATHSTEALKLVTEEFGVDINVKTPMKSQTILHRVMKRSQKAGPSPAKCHVFLQACLDLGANPLLHNWRGATPMHAYDPAFHKISLPCLVVLLRDGRLSINSQDVHGQTILYHLVTSPIQSDGSSMRSVERVLKSLLDLGCDRHIKTTSKNLGTKPNQTIRTVFVSRMKSNLRAYGYEPGIDRILDIFDNYNAVPNHPSRLDVRDWEWED